MSTHLGVSPAAVAKDREAARALARQLHDAAQPLSVLQGVLELALADSHTIDEYKQAIQRALKESSRLLACFLEMSNSVLQIQSETKAHTSQGDHV
jgi:hypothetical protein